MHRHGGQRPSIEPERATKGRRPPVRREASVLMLKTYATMRLPKAHRNEHGRAGTVLEMMATVPFENPVQPVRAHRVRPTRGERVGAVAALRFQPSSSIRYQTDPTMDRSRTVSSQ